MPHSTMLRLIAITSMLTALTACVGQNESASIENSDTGVGVLGSNANSNGSDNTTTGTPVVQGVGQTPVTGTQNSTPPAAEPVTEPAPQPVSDPVSEPVNEPTTQPVSEPVTQPVSDPVTQPVSDPVSQPVSEPTTQPVSDPVTNTDDVTLTLTWQPGPETLDGYVVAYGPTPDTATQQISDIKAFSGGFDFSTPSLQYSSWYNLGLHPGDNVCFKVRSYNADGLSDWSDAICSVIPQTSA